MIVTFQQEQNIRKEQLTNVQLLLQENYDDEELIKKEKVLIIEYSEMMVIEEQLIKNILRIQCLKVEDRNIGFFSSENVESHKKEIE